jgi:hypothetical protein
MKPEDPRLLAAIDQVIAQTGVERYRYLVLDHPSRKVRAEYAGLVRHLAKEPATSPAIPVDYAVEELPRRGGCCGG